LSGISAYITDHAPAGRHQVAANEGNAVALAAGHYLSTGRPGLVYMQNSGLGNAINPLVSLADPLVYRIPVLLLIGWRGEPQVPDEPQHLKQGLVTLPLLETLGLEYAILPFSNREAEETLARAAEQMQKKSEPFALLAGKGTFQPYKNEESEGSPYKMSREEALQIILPDLGAEDVVVSTTGKLSREIYEYRKAKGEGHGRDFLNVGSMGHASQVALGIALDRPQRRVYCLDGDGAVIMHMGALAINAVSGAENFRHLVFNNSAHDSVGGQATAGFQIDIRGAAEACGYRLALRAGDERELREGLEAIKAQRGPSLLEIRIRRGARSDLGRPKSTPEVNKKEFMQFLQRF